MRFSLASQPVGRFMFSASDVANFLACHHVLTLDRAESEGNLKRPYFNDLGVELLRELGARHEQAYLRHLIAQGLDVSSIPTDVSWVEGAAQTLAALHHGASVIYQATFQNGPWHGRSDFLIEFPSQLTRSVVLRAAGDKTRTVNKGGGTGSTMFLCGLALRFKGVQPDWAHGSW